jgi:hypothetical protein
LCEIAFHPGDGLLEAQFVAFCTKVARVGPERLLAREALVELKGDESAVRSSQK